MSVVTGALGSLAPKLLQLLHDEYKLQKGVKKQVEWLSRELNSIYAFLRKVSDVPWDRLDEQVKVWVREVREASYDLEDVLDTFLVRLEGNEPADPSRIKRTMKKMGKVFSKAKTRRDIAGAIEDIKKYLEEVAERRQKYKLDESVSKHSERRQKYKLDESVSKHSVLTSTIDPRLSAMYKEVTQLIGIDKSSEELISLLSPSHALNDLLDKKNMKKVSIVGVGGLGKTTLAKAVYDKLSAEYDCRAFVSVGRDRHMVTVLMDILFHLDKYKYHNIHTTGRGVDLLISELREFLENKRYFVVVDDVWDVETCKRIKLALIENCSGSKVITTTRKLDVAEEAGEVYKLKSLSFDNSKKLFYTRVFGVDGQYLDYKPDDVCDKILKRCDGIPLAIITVASLLAGKPKEEWFEVYKSIGFRHQDNLDVEDTMKILSFSYYDMPSHLQTCLLYLCTYPEDYNITKNELIWKWIAEGFVHEKPGERLFEIGERYFSDLINKSMVQAVEQLGIVSGCRVHDIVLDLLRKISLEENYIAILDGNDDAISSPSNVRRFAVHNRTAENVSSEGKAIQMPKVRSYTVFGCDINNNWMHIPSFRLLRMLDITDCNINEGCHLEHVGDLLHLRYLGIQWRQGTPKLLKQLKNLKFLQTLVLFGGTTSESNVLPMQLLCLVAPSCALDGIGKLTSLEQLNINGKSKMLVKELSNLRELRVLIINNTCYMDKSMQRDFVVSMNNLQKIQMIVMASINADTAMWDAAGFVLPRSLRHLNLVHCFCFSKVPSCIDPSRLPILSYLALCVDTMDEQDMKRLAGLPALNCLHLRIASTITASIINAGGNDGCFQKLWHLNINAIVQIQEDNKEDSSISLHIWNREGALPFSTGKGNCSKNAPSAMMPNLEVLNFCVPLLALKHNKGGCTNIGLEYLPSLQKVAVLIDCAGVSAEEVDAALNALKHACKVHPNHPTLSTPKLNEEKMVSTQDKEDEKQQEEAEVSQAVNNIDLGELSASSS